MQDCFCQLCGRSWWRYIHISYTKKGGNPQKKKSGKDPIYHLETFLDLFDLKSYVNIASNGSTDLDSGTHNVKGLSDPFPACNHPGYMSDYRAIPRCPDCRITSSRNVNLRTGLKAATY